MIEGKGLGNKKVNRVNVSLSNKLNSKLNKLAIAINMRPTTLAALLIEIGLGDAKLISELQREHTIHTAYRIVPIKDSNTGELEYVLNER